jgi:hypothetical protein
MSAVIYRINDLIKDVIYLILEDRSARHNCCVCIHVISMYMTNRNLINSFCKTQQQHFHVCGKQIKINGNLNYFSLTVMKTKIGILKW